MHFWRMDYAYKVLSRQKRVHTHDHKQRSLGVPPGIPVLEILVVGAVARSLQGFQILKLLIFPYSTTHVGQQLTAERTETPQSPSKRGLV